jgi:Tfp pilus assembly protein PilW
LITATCAANSTVPKSPANIANTSKAHHSKHYIKVPGTPSFKKTNHPLSVSKENNGVWYFDNSSERKKWMYTSCSKKFKVYVKFKAIAAPNTPSSSFRIRTQQTRTCKQVVNT